jgi:hypothetical protein
MESYIVFYFWPDFRVEGVLNVFHMNNVVNIHNSSVVAYAPNPKFIFNLRNLGRSLYARASVTPGRVSPGL